MVDTVSPTIAEAELLDITTSRLKDKQVWHDLAVAFDQVIQANVDDPIRQLELVRYLPPGADQTILADACRMLGFDLTQDVLNWSVDKFTSLVTQLGLYPDTNGTEDFTKFISMAVNGNCKVEYLYSKDYVNFYTTPKGAMIDDGGRWFKTTHVILAMGFLTLVGLQLKAGQSLYKRMIDLFYQQDPVTLVVDRMEFSAEVRCDIAFGAKMLTPDREYSLLCAGGRLLP